MDDYEENFKENLKKAEEFLVDPDWLSDYRFYSSNHLVKLRESLSKEKEMGKSEIIKKKVNWGWDHKRRLTGVTKEVKKLYDRINNYIEDKIKDDDYYTFGLMYEFDLDYEGLIDKIDKDNFYTKKIKDRTKEMMIDNKDQKLMKLYKKLQYKKDQYNQNYKENSKPYKSI